MSKQRPKLAPLTDEQREAVHMLAAELFGQAVSYAQMLNTYHAGGLKKPPEPPDDMDPEIAQVTREFLDAIGVKAEEIVMEPYDSDDGSLAA